MKHMDSPDKTVARFSRRQISVVVLCMFLNMLDGFDLFIIGFSIPHLPSGFATSGEKGVIISSALVGMGIGAIALARLADRVGRRSVVIAGIAINLLGLVGSALAVNFLTLMSARFVTGLGVGMVSVVIVVIAQECSPPTLRNLSTGIVMLGFPLGSTLAGLGGAAVLAAYDHAWQALFWLGSALSLVGLVIAYFGVPESSAFLAKKDPGITVDKVDRPNEEESAAPALLGRALRTRTILLALGYGMISAAYYFVGTWTPQLIQDATGDDGSGSTAGIVVSVGTLVGAVAFSVLGLRYGAVFMTWKFLAVSFFAVAGFALLLPDWTAYICAGALGLTVFAAMVGYTAMVPNAYPVLARAKGYGAMLGVGRVGAVVSPLLAGFALTFISPTQLYLLTTIPLGIAVVASLWLVSILGRSSNLDDVGADAAVVSTRAKPSNQSL